jgi:hypothetical protein
MIYNFSVNSVNEKDINLKKIAQKIKDQKKINKNFKVIDIGGGVQNKEGIPVDCLFDLNNTVHLNSKITIIKRDFCDKDAWNDLQDNQFDYAICTHTLEDIRDPKYVISQIIRVAKEGYIAVPHKHRELSYSTQNIAVGYAHHRWIFGFKNKKMLMIPKSNIVDYLFKKKIIKVPKNSKKNIFINLLRYFYFLYKGNFNKLFFYREIRESIKNYEYSFEFKDNFQYEILNDDCFLPPHEDYIKSLKFLVNLEDEI